MSCGLYAVNSFRRFDGRLGTLRRSMSTAVRTRVGPPTIRSGCNNVRAHASSLSARGLERGRMPPGACDRRTPSDVARRLAVLRLASGCETLEAGAI